jgi:hypothetical protein
MMTSYNNPARSFTALPTFTRTEMRNINRMVQKALLSEHMQRRLLSLDEKLQDEFNLSNSAWDQIASIKAFSIADFCGELMVLQGQSTT